MRLILLALLPFLLLQPVAAADPESASATGHSTYAAHAAEVTDYIQQTFLDAKTGVYLKARSNPRPDWVWLQSVMFADLIAASHADHDRYAPLLEQYFTALDIYWDAQATIPGYEPAPTQGNGHDKYYDDNAWFVIALAEAYRDNHDPRYLKRAEETLRFVLSGWDDELGGGIWWHERHKDGTKNTCANGPAAVGCLKLAEIEQDQTKRDALVAEARRIVVWTSNALQDTDGLFDDRKVVASGEIKRGKLTYNSALMLRAYLELYRASGDEADLTEAKRIGKAADWFIDQQTGVYRDPLRYAHFMVEADLDLYQTTGEAYLYDRAKRNVDQWYANWQSEKPDDMMTSACLARVLWLISATAPSNAD